MVIISLITITPIRGKVQMQIGIVTYQIKYNKGINFDTFRVKLGCKPHYINVLKESNMKAELVAKYLTSLRIKNDLTYEAIAEKSKRSESTVKNLCTGKTEDPRLDTVAPIVYAMGGSIDEMYNPEKSKDEIKETSVLAMKDIYENQLAAIKESYDEQISNIRRHYEQHHQDLIDNFEKRLADKREIIEMQKKEHKSTKIVAWVCGAILVCLLIAEVMNPNLGWLRY